MFSFQVISTNPVVGVRWQKEQRVGSPSLCNVSFHSIFHPLIFESWAKMVNEILPTLVHLLANVKHELQAILASWCRVEWSTGPE